MKYLIKPSNLSFKQAKGIISKYLKRTMQAIDERDYVDIKKCFTICERLYQIGNASVKIQIENVYIYSLPLYMPRDHAERKLIEVLLPPQLNSIYRRQLYAHGY